MLRSTPSAVVCLFFMCWYSPVAAFHYGSGDNSWETYAPGSLLQKLDKLTDVAVRNEPPPGQTTTTPATTIMTLRKAGEDEDYDSDDEEGSAETQQAKVDASDDVSTVDYERTYQQFVKKYFDRVHDDDGDFDGDVHVAAADDDSMTETQDYNDDDEPVPKATSTIRAKRDGCKKVRRNKQQCKICKNLKNNEVSETCSYSHKKTPQKYAFDSEKQYKRHKDDASSEEESKEADSDEEDAGRRRSHVKDYSKPTKARRQKSQPQVLSEPSSLCVRKILRQKVCYHCTDSEGTKLNRCYDAPRTHKRRNAAEQRIYKRTVAYETYERASTNDTDATTTPATLVAQNSNTTILSTPAPTPAATSTTNATTTGFRRKHTLYKVVRKQRVN